jgi:hypothetical protein
MLNKIKKKVFLKILAIIVSLFIVLTIILWLALPNILKNYIETNDTQWINREVSIEKIGINLLQCKVSIYNATIKEPNKEITFLAFDKLLVNFNFWDLVKKNISTDKITLTNLDAYIIQSGNQFNFSDLINSNNSEATETESEPINFILKNIGINNATINYTDTVINSKVVLDSITITDKIFTKDDSFFDANIAIHQPNGGWIKGDVVLNLNNNDYNINAQFEDWQLSPFKTYASSGIRLGDFSGAINANIELAGNNNYIKSSGKATVSNFNITDPENKPLINVGELLIDIKQIDTKESIYNFNNILVKDSNVYFEYLPNGDNFTKLLVNSTTPLEENQKTDYYVSPFEMLSVYIYDMTKEYIFTSYTADKIELSNFNLKFYDYTLEDAFYMDLQHLNIVANHIKPENQFAKFNIEGEINETGIIKGDVAVSRTGVENMKIDLSINGLFLNRFSPYGRFYTGHSFLEGISSFQNTSEIKDSYLTSINTLHVEQIKVSKKNKTQSGYSLPLRLGVSLLKDSNGNVDLEIPVEGPINDPKYKFGKVIWQVIKNLFLKVASSPVKALSNVFNIDEDDLKTIYFDNGQIGLSPKQKKPLEAIAKVIKKKPEFKIEFAHLYNIDYEMDAIAIKLAKIKYLTQSDITLNTSIPLGKQAFDLPSTDPEFLAFLKANTSNFDETLSIPENARRLIGHTVVQEKLITIAEKQKQLIKDYLINEQSISENSFTIKDGSNTDEAINQSSPKFEVKFNMEDE